MKKFLRLLTISIQSQLYYKSNFIINLSTPLIMMVGQFLLWHSLYRIQSGGQIGSMDKKSMYTYILLAFALNSLLSWSTENVLSWEIRDGSVVIRFIRPVSLLTQLVSQMVGSILLQLCINSVIIVVAFAFFSQFFLIPHLIGILQFIPCFLFGCLLRIMLAELFGILCFYTTAHLGLAWIQQALFQFFSGTLIPITLFPSQFQVFVYFTPFPYIVQVPISVLLGQQMLINFFQALMIQFFWIVGLYGIHLFIYRRIRRNLAIAGG